MEPGRKNGQAWRDLELEEKHRSWDSGTHGWEKRGTTKASAMTTATGMLSQDSRSHTKPQLVTRGLSGKRPGHCPKCPGCEFLLESVKLNTNHSCQLQRVCYVTLVVSSMGPPSGQLLSAPPLTLTSPHVRPQHLAFCIHSAP